MLPREGLNTDRVGRVEVEVDVSDRWMDRIGECRFLSCGMLTSCRGTEDDEGMEGEDDRTRGVGW